MSEGMPSPFRRCLLSAFILFHLGILIVWTSPPSYGRAQCARWIERYMRFIGLTQRWDMFAPPAMANFYLEARITYADGSEARWPIGRGDHLGLWDRLVQNRIQKFMLLVWSFPFWQPYLHHVARWAVWVNSEQPGQTPVKVELWKRWSVIPPPPGGLRQPMRLEWQEQLVYSRPVKDRRPQ